MTHKMIYRDLIYCVPESILMLYHPLRSSQPSHLSSREIQ